jgi:endogenous inhibitor of DNA gyrase (YacG/DUF329 family)
MAIAALKNCPICKKPSVDKYRPFCSSRCADVDLGRWFKESYAAPAEEDPELPDEETPEIH